jgi:MFS-type transporter involved in bile tolerance (Atg22 family)
MFLVGFMQLFGAIFTEALNIQLICSTKDMSDIVMNFVQFGIIAHIDNLYAQSLKNSFLMNVLNNSSIEINSNEEDKKKAE